MKKLILSLILSGFLFSASLTAADWDPFQENITSYYELFGTDSSYACGESYVPEYNPTVLFSPDSMKTAMNGVVSYYLNVQNRSQTLGSCLWNGIADSGYETHYTVIDSVVIRPENWSIVYDGDSLYISKAMSVGDSYTYMNGGFTSMVDVELTDQASENVLGESDDVRTYLVTVDGAAYEFKISRNYGIVSGFMPYGMFRPSLAGTNYENINLAGMLIDGGTVIGEIPPTDPVDMLINMQPGMKRFWSVKQQTYDPYYGCFDFFSNYYDSIMTVNYNDDWFVYEYIKQDATSSEIDSICLNTLRGQIQNTFTGNHIGEICAYDSIMYHNYGWTEKDTMADQYGDTLTLYSYMGITQQNYVWDVSECSGDTTAALFPYVDEYEIYNNKFGLIEFGDTIYDQGAFSGNSVIYSLVGIMTDTDTMGTTVGMQFFTPSSLNQYTGIYPNPVEVMFQVDIPFHHRPNPPYQIFNQMGQLVKTGYLDNLSMVMIPYLDKGLYYIQVDFGEEMIVEKFVKH